MLAGWVEKSRMVLSLGRFRLTIKVGFGGPEGMGAGWEVGLAKAYSLLDLRHTLMANSYCQIAGLMV